MLKSRLLNQDMTLFPEARMAGTRPVSLKPEMVVTFLQCIGRAAVSSYADGSPIQYHFVVQLLLSCFV